MNRGLVYSDASALAKLFLEESETEELRRFIGDSPRIASASVARVEVLRALRRAESSEPVVEQATGYLGRLLLRRVSEDILARAARLRPWSLGTVDALHLATALDFSPLPELFLCYDRRLAEAARHHGLAVVSPGADEVREP